MTMPISSPTGAMPGSGRYRRVHWPMWAYLGLALVMVLLMTASFTMRRGGVLYPLDDSYIHLALARTLADTGVWGLLPDRPSAASSSPLWSVLLGLIAKLSPFLPRTAFSWVPLIANLIAGAALVIFWRRRLSHTPWPNAGTLILILIVPVPTIAMIGMEHVLHALLASLLAWSAARALEQERHPTVRQLIEIGALSGLAVATRYETLAVVVSVAALAIYYRRWLLIPATLLPTVLVVVGFGWLWVRNGGWWVPNSFLLKAAPAIQGGVAAKITDHVLRQGLPAIALVSVLVGSLALLWLAMRRRQGPERVLLFLGIACTGGQLIIGQIGWLYRYEAWLMALDGLAILLAASRLAQGREWVFKAVAIGLLILCAPRAGLSFAKTARAAHDRDWEHFGPMDALAPLSGKAVLVNDIGVVSYYGKVRAIDVFGLADNESLRWKRERRMDARGARLFANKVGAKIGEFQICWDLMRRNLPAGWTLVEAWTGPRNVVFGDLTVGFMAEPGSAEKQLRSALAAADVPSTVHRFDASSPLVQAFNARADKEQAAISLCRDAAVMATGEPDLTTSE